MKFVFFLEMLKILCRFRKRKETLRKVLVLNIMAFECGGVTHLYYEGNSCDRQSTCYQKDLRSQILLKEVLSN